MRGRSARLTTAAIALALGVGSATPAALAADGPSHGARTAGLVVVQAHTGVPRGAVRLGALAGTSKLSLRVVLAPRDPGALAAFVAAASSPSSPSYGHYLTRGQFARRFSPTSATVDLVRATLRRDGLSVTATSPSHLVLSVSGRVESIARTLHASFSSWRLASGRSAYDLDGAARLPSSIARYVAGIVGLSSLAAERSFAVRGTRRARRQRKADATGPAVPQAPVACSEAQLTLDEFPQTLSPAQEGQAYGLNTAWQSGDFGAGHTVALVEFAPYAMSDILTYDKCFGTVTQNATSDPELRNVLVDGGTSPGSASYGDEPTLDIEQVRALAPDAHVVVYLGPNTVDGPLDTLQRIATDDVAQVVSTSWGICERFSDAAAETPIFEQLAAQGQTVFAAGGDNGSSDCLGQSPAGTPLLVAATVDDPASQPLVTAVGGLTVSSVSPLDETVWNDCTSEQSPGCLGDAGGGGASSIHAHPSWQSAPGVPTGSERGSTRRDVPDLSVLADPVTGMLAYYQGGYDPYGGTSMGAPLMAALDADAAQSCGTQTFGFLNPLLYAMGRNGGDFNDVTTGTNAIAVATLHAHEFVAGAGYDMASGLGSPDPASFLGALCLRDATASASPTGPGAPSSWVVAFHTGDGLAPGTTITLTAPPGTRLPASTTSWSTMTSLGSDHPSAVATRDGEGSTTPNVATVTLAVGSPVTGLVTISATSVTNPNVVGTAAVTISDSANALTESASLTLSSSTPSAASLSVGGHTAGVTTQLGGRGVEVRARVTNASGDAVAGATIVVRATGGAVAHGTSGRTDDAGEATFVLRDDRATTSTVSVAANGARLGSLKVRFTDPWRTVRAHDARGLGGEVGIPAATATSPRGSGFVALARTRAGGLVVAHGETGHVSVSVLKVAGVLPRVASDPSLTRAGGRLDAAYRSTDGDLVVLDAPLRAPDGIWRVDDLTRRHAAPRILGTPDLAVTGTGARERLTIGVVGAGRQVLDVSAPASASTRFGSVDVSARAGEGATATGNVAVAALGSATYLFADTGGSLVGFTSTAGGWVGDDLASDALLLGRATTALGSPVALGAGGLVTVVVRTAGGLVEYVGTLGNWAAAVLAFGPEGSSRPSSDRGVPRLVGDPALRIEGSTTVILITSSTGRLIELSSLGVSHQWSSYDLTVLAHVRGATSGVAPLPGPTMALLGAFAGTLSVVLGGS